MTKKEKIVQLHAKGVSIRNIKWQVGVAKSYVTRILKTEREKTTKTDDDVNIPKRGHRVSLPPQMKKQRRLAHSQPKMLELRGEHLERYLALLSSHP